MSPTTPAPAYDIMRILLAIAVGVVGSASASAMEVNLDLSQFTAVWTFDQADPLADNSGHGNNLVLDGNSAYTPTFGTVTSSGNGWSPYATSFDAAQPYDTSDPFNPVFNGAGRVAKFDGNDRLNIPNGTYTGGSFTAVIGQMRDDPSGSFRTLLSSSRFRYQNVNQRLQGGTNNNGGSGGSFGGSHPLNVNDWYLIALQYDDVAHTLTSYALTNGDDFGSHVMMGSGSEFSNATDFQIGFNQFSGIGGGDGFDGELDFILFDNSALSQAQLEEIADYFVFGAPVPAIPLTPEPASIAIFGVALAGLGAYQWRRRRSA